ncbi:MAG: thiamine-monophosphate kinase [Verrucomicrobia bacterium]|nr:thiamine-monophosphate kinase [Verrucomicrobiota bacterium]
MGALTAIKEKSVSVLTEARLIEDVVAAMSDACPPAPEGPGSDCAHLPECGGRAFRVCTVDGVTLGRHFDLACTGRRAGAKLVNRNLSDLAAAGARPSDALLALTLGPDVDAEWLRDFAFGAGRAAVRARLRIVGGDFSRGPAGVFVATLSAQGYAHRVLARGGAREGDVLFVTGALGGTAYGRHLDFAPRLAEGEWLCGRAEVTACTDVSDGLVKDLPGMLGTRLDAKVDLARIPVSEAAGLLSRGDGKPALEHALQDGEDHELAFAVSPSAAGALAADFRKAFPATPLSRLGSAVRGEGRLLDAEGRPVAGRGFDHFA